MSEAISVPGEEYQNGYEALEQLSAGATRAWAAVAFVTSSGAELVAGLLAERPDLKLSIAARGAPVSEPEALVSLAEIGVEVSLIVGADAFRFHPKLWLLAGAEELHVLSGSGNLTNGGMRGNAEQFECFSFAAESEEARLQIERLEHLSRGAVELEALRATPFWSAWEKQANARREIQAQERELDEALARTASSEVAKAELYADLLGLYERTKAQVTITDKNGGQRPYVATRFKQSIDMGQADGSIVTKVHGIVRKPTEGFNHLADQGSFDLTVERLVLDSEKPYHHLFSEETKERARSNLRSYESKGE
jgi:hypothetical protein